MSYLVSFCVLHIFLETDSPIILRVRNSLKACSIGVINRITSRIASGRNLEQITIMQMVCGEGLAGQELGCFDDCGRESHFNMPLDMTVEKKNARVISFEPQHGVGVGVDVDDVAPRWLGGEATGAAGVVARSALRTAHDLELVAVEVEGVTSVVLVVDDDVHDGVVTHDERVDVAIDDGVGVGVACGGGGVQRRYLLGDVGLAVDACSDMGIN